MVFYAIHPIKTALIRDSDSDKCPSGYAFDDNYPFYIEATHVTTKDSKAFREAK
jgi:hypothetical protein